MQHTAGALEGEIRSLLEEEVGKLVERHQTYLNDLHAAHLRRQRRLTSCPPKKILIPAEWSKDRRFNPFYVGKHLDPIARSVALKLRNGTYKPEPPFIRSIAKASGGTRSVNSFQIPDAVVSTFTYRALLARNRHRFSSYAYAYRDDRNVQFAVQDLAVSFRRFPRLYICELDFKDFFGSLSWDFLHRQFSENGFLVSPLERDVIQRFLDLQPSKRGIPQGTSISLFLANLACWRLDSSLERLGVQFARYADDTIIWAPDYGLINKAYSLVADFSKESGAIINLKKVGGDKHGMPAWRIR